jgi:hypothetical protein
MASCRIRFAPVLSCGLRTGRTRGFDRATNRRRPRNRKRPEWAHGHPRPIRFAARSEYRAPERRHQPLALPSGRHSLCSISNAGIRGSLGELALPSGRRSFARMPQISRLGGLSERAAPWRQQLQRTVAPPTVAYPAGLSRPGQRRPGPVDHGSHGYHGWNPRLICAIRVPSEARSANPWCSCFGCGGAALRPFGSDGISAPVAG